ncbi:MAG: hypothetical protein AAF418_05255 [Pseudomonadota bacterium]
MSVSILDFVKTMLGISAQSRMLDDAIATELDLQFRMPCRVITDEFSRSHYHWSR